MNASAIFFLLVTKHFVLDFICQGPYQYKNKGIYGHPGGILHSGLAALGTLAVLLPFFSYEVVLTLAAIEFVIHYHEDWFKVYVNNKFGLTPTNSERFWWLLGFDQWIHYLTYVGMVAVLDK